MEKIPVALVVVAAFGLFAAVSACEGDSAGGSFDAGSFETGGFDGATATDGGATTLSFVSGPDWPSFDGDLSGQKGAAKGMARNVCVNPMVPANCPAGAVVYRMDGGGWSGVIAAPSGATWIWRGDVAVPNVADLQFALFEKTFTLGAHPSGSISMTADDFVAVRVNGMLAGSAGSVTDVSVAYAAQTTAKTVDLTPYLQAGPNTITVIAQNGPQSFASCAAPCTFFQNTAGTMFAGTLTSE